MLQLLRIENLALLEAVELRFEAGFTAITGETGAGKSILLGAISLLAGERADKTVIRQGASACVVEGVLQLARTEALDRFLEELGLPPCEENTLLLRRELHRSRSPRIEVNGRLTTLANLQRLGEWWVDFHGPGEPQQLLRESRQRELLDLSARVGPEAQSFATGYAAWREQRRQAEELRRQERLDPDQLDFFRRQLETIDQADLSEEKVAELERSHHRLSRAQELLQMAERAETGLFAEGGLTDRLGEMVGVAREMARLDPVAEPLARRLESAAIDLQDLAGELTAISRACEFDEETSRALSERMNRWLELRRKYGGTVASVLERRRVLAERLSAQEGIEETLARLEREAEARLAELRVRAAALTESRRVAARRLAEATRPLLQALGLPKARLEVEVYPEPELREHGDSGCRLLFAANPGQELLPLHRIASSGELARVMLALKTLLAGVDAIPVLIFDEVDANVGGEIGQMVGRELAGLGRSHQVFCVTHLPQVAAWAAHHFTVEKEQTDAATRIALRSVHDQPDLRVAELARMLGDRQSPTARRHAGQLLAQCGPPA